MVHELVKCREEVQLALDILASRLKLGNIWDHLEHFLENSGHRVPQAVLDMVDALVFDEDVHEAIVFRLKSFLHSLN